ncbi:hypothetical protein [Klebsiella pneumoniae]|nr:hypothetical protein [Klebsiella pneumoniae]
MAVSEDRQGTAGVRYPHPLGADRAHSPPAWLVESHRGTRHDRRPAGRGFLCRTSAAHRARPGPDPDYSAQRHRAVGAVASAERSRRLAGQFPGPAQRLHAECDQRLRGRAGLAGAARDCRHTARLSQGGCAANPVGHRRTRTGAIIPDHGRCNRVPGLCPAPDPARALGGATSTTRFGGMAPLLGRLVRTLGSVCADGALGAVPVAHRAALCAGQPFRRRQGTRSRLAARTGYGARLYRGRMATAARHCRRPGMVLRLVRAGSTTPALHARLRLCHGPAR